MPDLSLAPTLTAAALFTTPLLIAATGELVAERAGVVNIGIEGMMLTGALAAYATTAALAPSTGTGLAIALGILAAILAAGALGYLLALAVVPLGADQIVAGTGINLLAVGGTALGYKALSAHVQVAAETAPPSSGPWAMGVAAVVIALLAALYFRFTRGGLELAAVGEAPHAADAAGVPVNRRRVLAVLVGAACAGLAGAYLATLRVLSFQENMTEGQGFLALAIVIFGRWSAVGVIIAAAFFGVARAVAIQAEAQQGPLYPLIDWLLSSARPENRPAALDAVKAVLKALPYVVTLIALAGVAGRPGAPGALGKPYARA